MQILIVAGGIHSLLFALFHCLFWQKLNWKKALACLDATNNAVLQILNLRIIFIFFFHTYLCLFHTVALLTSSIGRVLLVGSAMFWLGRTIEQFIFIKKLPFNNPFSYLLTVLFITGSIVYLIPLFA